MNIRKKKTVFISNGIAIPNIDFDDEFAPLRPLLLEIDVKPSTHTQAQKTYYYYCGNSSMFSVTQAS